MSEFANKTSTLNKKIKLSLDDQIRFSSVFVEHSYDPTFFLPEILKNN